MLALAEGGGRRLGANRTGNYSYNTLKEKNVRGDSPPHLAPSDNYFLAF